MSRFEFTCTIIQNQCILDEHFLVHANKFVYELSLHGEGLKKTKEPEHWLDTYSGDKLRKIELQDTASGGWTMNID